MMKKALSAAVLLTTSLSAQADFILGGDVEVNAWMPTVELDGSEADSISTPALTAEASLEHVIPIIPNLKGSLTHLSEGDLTYKKMDAILYYEILDNDLVSFDVGVGATSIDFSGQTSDFNIGDVSGTLPTAYINGEVGIPATPLFVYAKGYLSGDGDTTVMDASAGVQYSFGLIAFDVELQAGYRLQNIDFDDFDGSNSEVDMSGLFAGLNIDF